MSVVLTRRERLLVNATPMYGNSRDKCNNSSPMHAIHIKDGWAEAVDGFIMVRKRLKDGFAVDEMTIPVCDMVKWRGSDKIAFDENRDGTISMTDDKSGARVVLPAYDFVYPDTSHIRPESSPMVSFAVSRNILIQLTRCLSPDDNAIVFTVCHAFQPIKFRVGDVIEPSIEGVIMPMDISKL